MTDNKAWKDAGPEKGDVYIDMNETPWVCPVTALPMNGTSAFFVNWTCGCVFSEKAHLELKTETCLGCGDKMDEKNLIKLYPEEELLKTYQERVAQEVVLRKQKRAERKTQEEATKPGESSSGNVEKRKLLPTNGNGGKVEPKKAKKEVDVSIQDNPNLPKSVKAMFTSSAEAKNQPKQHWVTHNPLYY